MFGGPGGQVPEWPADLEPDPGLGRRGRRRGDRKHPRRRRGSRRAV